ncbi:MAG: rRNA pseudouridine synthase [Candidatus Marinimicrobia bacterium]|nr:rRNA pseudouridine synthase [Candidatus Neomarinimicrobiota bacterium]
MRLNRVLAQAGVASRRKADQLIAAGRVRVNGKTVSALGIDVAPDELVEVDGKPVEAETERVVYLLHKPAGVLSAVSDSRGRQTVVDLIRDSRRLYPVGRLDRDTTGALLITNDGELSNRLTHPRYGVEKHYLAEVKGQLSRQALGDLKVGTKIDGGLKVRAVVRSAGRNGRHTVYGIILTEGRKREIKRIFRHYDLPLVRLHRSSFAGLSSDSLAPGKYRRLHRAEIDRLYRMSNFQHGLQTS